MVEATKGLRNVDPDLEAVIPLLPDFDRLDAETVGEFRALLAGTIVEPGVCDGVDVRVIQVPGSPPVPALLYVPVGAADSPRPAILNIHGGGFVCGDAARENGSMIALARDLDCVILSIDYRLAPENPYPAAADDCLASLEWLHASTDSLGIDPARIAVRGVSAGGGLAAGLGLRVRSRPDLPICYMLLVYPMLDDRTEGDVWSGKIVWTAGANRFGWSSFLAEHAVNPPVEAVPGREEDLCNFPPTFLAIGDIDLFARENLDFAQRLMKAGIPVELHLYPGAYHGFVLIVAARVSLAFERDCRAALGRAFALTSENKKLEGLPA